MALKYRNDGGFEWYQSDTTKKYHWYQWYHLLKI